MLYAQISQKGIKMYNLTGIYWIKNEARYLPEYLEFHLLQGFDHFIFYDNESTDNLEEIIKPYIDSGIVEIRKYPNPLHPPAKSGPEGAKNFWLMDYCIDEQKEKSKWIHFHAIDERLYSPSGENLIDILKDFEEYGGLSVAWKLFNSNGHLNKPNGLIIENYVTFVEDFGKHVKTIIQPKFTKHTCGNPHNFYYIDDKNAVTENKIIQIDANCESEYSMKRIKLNHYVTLSKEEHKAKMKKGLLDFGKLTENVKRSSAEMEWKNSHTNPFYIDAELLKFVEPVREAIKNRYAERTDLLEYINH
jgi:hypothetical protein